MQGFCLDHNVSDTDTCNRLRHHFFAKCFTDYLDDFMGPVYTIVLKDVGKFNLQMKKSENHINETIERFCSSLLPPIGPFSQDCVSIKDELSDAVFLNPHNGGETLLESMFYDSLDQSSDMQEHMIDHLALAMESESVMELGVRGMTSTWGVLMGLFHNERRGKRYIGVDLRYPSGVTWKKFEKVCLESHIDCVFLAQNDMMVVPSDVGPIDVLFIDALHTYCHVLYELTTFQHIVHKYIALHDTSDPWGRADESYYGDYSEYPTSFDKSKKGVFTAVEDFLEKHSSDWEMKYRKESSSGYTVLQRKH